MRILIKNIYIILPKYSLLNLWGRMELNAKSFIWFKRLHNLLEADMRLSSSQELKPVK